MSICFEDIIKEFPKTIRERIDKALVNLAVLSPFAGAYLEFGQNDYPIFYPDNQDPNSCWFMMQLLFEERFIESRDGQNKPHFPINMRLTHRGWNRIIELEKGKVDSNKTFVAMWFHASMADSFKKGISRAISECGYEPIRVDFEEHNEKICDRIIADIRKSKFVVCDFTGHRGGVYFEAGFAMGLDKPVIWTCKEDDVVNLHFDTRQYNHIVWKDEDDLYEKLKRRIEATIV